MGGLTTNFISRSCANQWKVNLTEQIFCDCCDSIKAWEYN